MTAEFLSINDVTKYYGDQPALQGVSFTVPEGELFGLLGPNGAGKTTTLRILCTVLKPTGGTATVAGFDVATQPTQVRQHVGYLSASTGVYDRMSAWEMVEYFGRLYGIESERLSARMEEVFTSLQMNDLRDILGAFGCPGVDRCLPQARRRRRLLRPGHVHAPVILGL